MSRFRVLALFATLVALASVFAACGGGDDGDGGASNEDPQELVENFVFEGVKSGELDLSMHVKATGDDPGEFEVDLSGPFEQGAKGQLPQLDMSAEVSGEGESFSGGLTLLTDRAFVDYEGTVYEVDPTTFSFVKAALEQGEQQRGDKDFTACQEAGEEIKFSQFTDNLKNEGTADVGGVETTKVSGDVDVPAFIDTAFELAESPACASQLEAAGSQPKEELEESRDEVVDSIKRSHIELYVGEDDIARKMVLEMTVAPKEVDGEVEMEIEVTLTGVNEEQSFSAPADAKPLEDLFKQLGVDPLKLLEATQGKGFNGLLEGITGGLPSGGE